MLLRPGDAHHTDYQAAFNLRTALKPQLRALCKTSKAAGVMVDWCRATVFRSQCAEADIPTRVSRKAPASSSTCG